MTNSICPPNISKCCFDNNRLKCLSGLHPKQEMPEIRTMKTNALSYRALVFVGLSLGLSTIASAATILQSAGANAVAFEAEANVTITPGTPTSFVITNDPTPSGSTALFTSGPLGQGTDYPRGFASYSIKFNTPGLYKFFYRWRANPVYGQADLNTGNSFRM